MILDVYTARGRLISYPLHVYPVRNMRVIAWSSSAERQELARGVTKSTIPHFNLANVERYEKSRPQFSELLNEDGEQDLELKRHTYTRP